MCAQTQTGDSLQPQAQFLSFLHNAGVVFWREGICFDDQLILDQKLGIGGDLHRPSIGTELPQSTSKAKAWPFHP